MQLIRSALAHDVHLVCAEAVFSRVCLALNLELLDSILGENDCGSIESSIGIDQTIECVIVRGWTAAIDTDCIAFALAHLPLFAVSLHGAGSQEQQAHKISVLDRQLFDLRRRDGLCHSRGICIQRHSACLYFDAFGHSAGAHSDVNARLLSDCQCDTVCHRLLKTLSLYRYTVASRRQKGDGEVAR